MGDTANKFSPITLFLHWVVALTIIGMIAMGFYMDIFHVYGLYLLHKSIGVLIFVVIIIRVIWRLQQGWPTPVGNYAKAEVVLAKVVHHILLIASILMPLSGMLMSGLGGYGINIFGIELVPINIDAATGKTVAHNAAIAEITNGLHWFLAYLLMAAIALHVAGALKHHLFDKDGTLMRMFGKTV